MIQEIHPREEMRDNMPFAPAVEVTNVGRLIFLAGCSPLPLYHKHPHVPDEIRLSAEIEEQTHKAMQKVEMILEAANIGFDSIVKITEYVVDIREINEIRKVMREYLGDHRPPRTLVEISALSSPQARVEFDMIAVAK